MRRRNIRWEIVGIALAGLALFPLFSSADNSSSTSFLIRDAFIGPFGGFASSSNFQMMSGGAAIVNDNGTSTSFGARTGPVNFTEFIPQSAGWRWYGDANDETPTSSLAAEDVAPSNIANQQMVKLRMTIREVGGAGSNNAKFVLQFSTASDFSAGLGAVAEAANCNATSSWCYATSTGGNDNAVITAKVLSDADACSGGAGAGCGTHNTSGVSVSTSTQQAGAATEYEFTVKPSGASASTVFFFRAVNVNTGLPAPLYGTSTYPSLAMQGASLSFSVAGLAQGTNTNGVVTDVSTTPAGVPFGTLPLNVGLTGAQRLFITTNASSGYELYVQQDAPLISDRGDVLPGVFATNAIPQAWASGCAATSSGCYGYHTSAAVLSGGSTRFAAADTYAQFATTTGEIGYSATAVSSDTLDLIYKMQISGTQGNGSYGNNISYIVVSPF